MPVDHKNKFKFIHIPKTGGSSVEVVFDLQHEKNLFVPRYTHEIQQIKFAPQHFTHNMINHFVPEAKDYFSFTIVRNPYTKIISEYFYIAKAFHGVTIEQFREAEFVAWFRESLCLFDLDHKIPQSSFLDSPVDMILRFENLEEDFQKLKKELGVEVDLIHDNKSTNNKLEIAQSLSEETKMLIREVFAQDFIQFSYENNI